MGIFLTMSKVSIAVNLKNEVNESDQVFEVVGCEELRDQQGSIVEFYFNKK